MGAAISLPLIPITSLASCCGAATCSALCTSIGGTFQSSILTRITYAFILLLNSLFSWIALSPFIVHKLEKASFGFINNKCGPDGSECISFTSVYRINFALGIFHLILAGLLVNVKSTSNPRAVIQNGCWKMKIFAWLSLITVNFLLIPDNFFIFYGNNIAIIFSTIFLGIGLILLVDFAHAWAETCLEKIEMEDLTGEGEYNAGFWKKLLIGGTLTMYISSIVLTIIMYWFFAGSGCNMNRTAITLNVVFGIIISIMSVNQTIQESNPHAGLAQSSMVVIYCTYLVMSAVSSEPDDKYCNPLIRSKGTRTASVVLGAFFTFIAVAYTTTRAAANSAFIDLDTAIDSSDGYISSQPNVRNEMRYQAIKQAVDEGSLPESALNQMNLYDDESNGDNANDEERNTVKYNYTLFHIIFFLATQYVATLLTINVQQDDLGDFVPVGRTYFSSWVKIVSSWVCFVLYGWSLIAPVLWPDRFSVHL
ncbi:DEHA2E16676p [Debaryomyces hansenii CBS767]|uniref:DEHA2E16676p n=1 Tax=Debaryomyces hansenii (strain ATCC 36239 / CBS 767 / BCRC 21394 / JCM 1990 / NBRC 0083 / IGC 2968) TaxID=284592 RepID=Q6BP43_DEBHA|nr:DEHA2E16676p [Debaryomyces hansenii CBS767]CAG88283.2 DEHA2E16676p [Debaryomyces hansenii CBS767]|eukprot:XP_460027.2 DEHA2E16676p [Debaryomyces hansenii CBS767]